MKYISTKNMELQQWLDLRKDYIGASDAGAVLGFNPWKSPVDVWLDKTGKTGSQDDNLAMLVGREMEPTIKRLFEDQENLKVRNDNKIRLDDEYPFLGTNLDGLVVGERVPVEYKTTAIWDHEIPDFYFVQIQHQMMITGAKDCYLAVLVLGMNKQFIVEKVKRVDDFVAKMRENLVNFWEEHVLKEVPPDPKSLKDVKRIYTKTDPESIKEANEDIFSEYLSLTNLREKRSDLDREISKAQMVLMNYMQDKEVIEKSGIPIVTWKKSREIRRFDRKRFSEEHPNTYREYVRELEGRRRFLLKDVEPIFNALEGARDE